MPRPQAFTDEQLLAAAREVFLERGVLATTAEVATRAGVAEGTLFYRFKTKAALFQAALRPDLEEPHWLASLEALAKSEDLDAALRALGQEVLTHFRKAVPLLMMQWSNPPPVRPEGGGSPGPGEHVPARAVRRLAAFFESHMRAGRLRPGPPDVAARVFLGGFLHYAFHEAMDPAAPKRPAEPYVRDVVALLLSGLSPLPQVPASRPVRRSSRKGSPP